MTFELTSVQLLGLFVAFSFVAVTTIAWFAFAFLAYGEIRAFKSQHPEEGGEKMDMFWFRIRENLIWPTLFALPAFAGLQLGAISIEPEGRFLVFVGLTIAAALVYMSLSATIPNLQERRRLVGMRKNAERKHRSHAPELAVPQPQVRQPTEAPAPALPVVPATPVAAALPQVDRLPRPARRPPVRRQTRAPLVAKT